MKTVKMIGSDLRPTVLPKCRIRPDLVGPSDQKISFSSDLRSDPTKSDLVRNGPKIRRLNVAIAPTARRRRQEEGTRSTYFGYSKRPVRHSLDTSTLYNSLSELYVMRKVREEGEKF